MTSSIPYESSAEGNPVQMRLFYGLPGQLDQSELVDEGQEVLSSPYTGRYSQQMQVSLAGEESQVQDQHRDVGLWRRLTCPSMSWSCKRSGCLWSTGQTLGVPGQDPIGQYCIGLCQPPGRHKKCISSARGWQGGIKFNLYWFGPPQESPCLMWLLGSK